MTAFPRTILPYESSIPEFPDGLSDTTHSGKLNTRAMTQVGCRWVEKFRFDVGEDGHEFLAQIRNWKRNGSQLEVQHQSYLTTLGDGGGTPLVNAASQTGQSITSDGWPNSTTVLKAGDLITFASIVTVYEITADVTSNGSGVATLTINPPVFAGGSPADNDAITITASVVFTAKIIKVDFPSFGPYARVAGQVVFQEDV
jgi:hypothetical protein